MQEVTALFEVDAALDTIRMRKSMSRDDVIKMFESIGATITPRIDRDPMTITEIVDALLDLRSEIGAVKV